MKNTTIFKLGAFIAFLLLTLSCSQDAGKAEPEPATVTMDGNMTFPVDSLVHLDDVVIGFGDYENAVDATGAFSIDGNAGIPGLALAYGQDTIPMLMSIVPDPQKGTHIEMDVHSTALSLAFLSPFVCVSDPTGSEEVLSALEGLPQMEELEEILLDRLSTDPKALSAEDEQTDSALTRLVRAYINSYPSALSRYYPSGAALVGMMASPADVDVVIEPGYPVSGHEITHVSGDKFKISNSRGRWAYCLTPRDSFYVFPNGTLLDALRGRVWPPSQREFTLKIIPNEDPVEVNVYGLGWASDPDNLWDNLSESEQEYVINAGLSTVLLEFVPHVISVISNSSKTLGSGEIAKNQIVKMLGFMKKPRTVDRLREYIRAGNPYGMVWFLTKTAIGEFVRNDQFRATFLETIGLTLRDGALKKIAGWLILPAKVVLLGDSVTSVMKTTLGFYSTRFKTTFEIWKEETAFGNITGSVHDKESGLPIEGATVDLEGDDSNPMDPSHQDITSASGHYYFENIMVGEKTLRASKEGYRTKSIVVTVVEDTTITAPYIELEKVSGSVSGTVIDEILLENGIADPTFRKELTLQVTEIGGEHYTASFWVYNGSYRVSLTPGTYLLKAMHEDYHPDSIQVVVEADSHIDAPRNLLMKPVSTVEGTVYLDMDANGSYETVFTFAASLAGARKVELSAGKVSESALGSIITIVGMAGSPFTDGIEIYIDPGLVTGPGAYALGGIASVGVPGSNAAAGVVYVTARFMCHNQDEGYSQEMVFIVGSDPDFEPCNCGITDYGNLYLEEFGSELTDVIQGGITADLAGWNTCECYCCEDLDHDGSEDDWVVDCAKAQLNIDFKVLVGSLYQSQLELTPSQALGQELRSGRRRSVR